MNDNERHVETIWPPMFGFRLLPTNSDLIKIKKLFRAANFSGAGGDEKLKIIFNWPKLCLYRNVFNEDIDPVPAAAPVSEPQGSRSSDEFISVYI